MSKDFKIVFLFSGQGSHYRGMGSELYKKNPVFKSSLERSDAWVSRLINRSLIEELYFRKEEPFNDLLVTHAAIVAIEIAMFRVLQERDILFDFVCGNSLGEFASGVAAGIWTEEMAIETAVEQAKSIVRNDVAGGMLAVINEARQSLEQLYSAHDLHLASDNYQGNFTLSGAAENIESFRRCLEERNILSFRLPVAHPFHSPLLDKARLDFEMFTANMEPLKDPLPGFISSVGVCQLKTVPGNYFWRAVSEYTDFTKLVRYLEGNGPCLYVDLGPSGSSANIVKYNLTSDSSSKVFDIMSQFKTEEQKLKGLNEFIGKL